MNLTQFKAFCAAAKLNTGKFTPDRLDDIFTAAAASPAALERKLDSTASTTMMFADFLVALTHVAYHRFAALVRPISTHLPFWCSTLLCAHCASCSAKSAVCQKCSR